TPVSAKSFHRRHQANLLKQRQRVVIDPGLYNQALCDPVKVHARIGDDTPRRGDTKERPLLGATRVKPSHHQITLGDLFVDEVSQIRESAPEQSDRLLDPFWPPHLAGLWPADNMVDIVGCVQLVRDLELALAPKLKQYPPSDQPVRGGRSLIAHCSPSPVNHSAPRTRVQ